MRTLVTSAFALFALAGCAHNPPSLTPAGDTTHADTVRMSALARELSSDSMRGRGPWTPENERAARRLAAALEQLGAKPVFGDELLVPFVARRRPDTVYNVVGILPNRSASTDGELIGITAHLDHLGVGKPDASGDSIYNGFLDAALPVAMVLDVARRYSHEPGDRALLVMFFNLEEQGLLGSMALTARADAPQLLTRLKLLIGVDAGSPAGVATAWQLMGATPLHTGAVVADSLARAKGWTTTFSAPRAISDVYPFSQHGVPILFPIPGATWEGYSEAQRAQAMKEFDHYHQPADEWRADFPLVGTKAFADWLWDIVRVMSSR